MNTRIFSKATLLIGTILTAGLGLHAETLKLTVPFAFTAGGKTLPAGSYTMNADSGLLMIQGASETVSVIVTRDAMVPGKTAAIFETRDGKATLSSLTGVNGTAKLVQSEHAAPSAKGSAVLARH